MLTVERVKNASARERPYKLFDDRGLYLLVNPNGSKLWRYRYRYDSKDKTLALGPFPEIKLSEARAERDEARRLHISSGIDPVDKRRAEKAARKVAQEETFKAIAEEWLKSGCPGSNPSDKTIKQLRLRLTKYVYPNIGRKPIVDVSIGDLRTLLTAIGHQGKSETAHRVRSLCERIYRYAIATERADRNIAMDLKGTLPPTKTKGFAAITEAKPFGELIRAISTYEGQPTTMAALKLAPLVFVRPIELRAAEWSEVDLEEARWSIPDRRMKERRPHVVPLASQSVSIFSELSETTGGGQYVFPSLRSPKRPMSDNTLNAALRRLGYGKEEMSTHGFRKSASTLLHELGFSPDVIETQLAHKRPGVAGIYNKSYLLPQRIEMMQAWADYVLAFSGKSN